MSNPSLYNDLNIREGAPLSEIKAAFRKMAKTCHPDSAGPGREDVEKFIKAQTAYKKLLATAVAKNRARRKGAQEREAQPYLWEGRREEGLDIFYSLSVLRPEAGEGRRLVLPAKTWEACPRCLGEGRTLTRIGLGGLHRPTLCPKFEGRGSIDHPTKLAVNIAADQVGRGRIRLRRAGLYHALSGRRGDLILELAWVDRLTKTH